MYGDLILRLYMKITKKGEILSEDNVEDVSVITSVNTNDSDLSLTATATKVSKRKKSSKKKIMIFDTTNKGVTNE